MGILLLFANQAGAAQQKPGAGVAGMVGSGTNAIVYVETGKGVSSGVGSGVRATSATVTRSYPEPSYQVAFSASPLTVSPVWVNLSSRLRGVSVQRGRSYEFNRMEAGTLGVDLSNRDAALSPANTASIYNPIKSTRPVQLSLFWDQTYPVFRGISEGFPQAFPSLGKDALVQLNAADFFYAINQTRFTPGSTTLAGDFPGGTPDTPDTMTVASTRLPMPQSVPFVLTLDEGAANEEAVEVLEIVDSTTYTVMRGQAPLAHTDGATVTTRVVSFGEALSGTRIQQVLEAVGFTSAWYDLDAGQTIMAASGDLAAENPLDHINLITEAEFGRFFVSREGKFTFRDRHSIILDFISPVATFRDLPVSGSEVPYRIEGVLEHSEEKLFNRVKITIPSGDLVDIQDEASIDDHFERVFAREWPYASINDAEAAAHFILGRSVEHALRLPKLAVQAAISASVLWPIVLAREIGDRVRFRYQPEAGGTEIDQEMIIEGIGHEIAPKEHVMRFQLTEADQNEYWILGLAGYSELGETTWVGF